MYLNYPKTIPFLPGLMGYPCSPQNQSLVPVLGDHQSKAVVLKIWEAQNCLENLFIHSFLTLLQRLFL